MSNLGALHAGRRRRRWLGATAAAVVTVAAVALGYAGYSGAFKPRAEKKKSPVPLEFVASEVTRPQLAKLPIQVDFSGPLVAPRMAVVRAKASGSLIGMRVAEGHRVRAGQVIGEIDLTELQSRANDRAANVESAQASLAEAERQHKANVGLAAQNFISPTALQSSQARLDSAGAQLRSADAQLATSRVGVREASMTVPISGIVARRHVVPGEKVSAEQPIVTIVDLSTLELAGTVGTHQVSLLAAGQPVVVSVEGQAQQVQGRIDRIAPMAEAGTRAIGVVVTLANPAERFRAGQYAQARVELPDAEPRLTVPQAAVGQASGQDFVWTIEDGALARRIVITGRRDPEGGRVEIVKGLTAEALLLAVRFENLKEGLPALVVAQRRTPAASSASGVPGVPGAAGKSAAAASTPPSS